MAETTMAGMEAIRVRMSGVKRGGRRVETVQVWADKGRRRYMVQLGVYDSGEAARFRRLKPTFERPAAIRHCAVRVPTTYSLVTEHQEPDSGDLMVALAAADR